jgi:hypothetical protein
VLFTQIPKGSKEAKKTRKKIMALDSAVDGLLLCVFASFASLREIGFRYRQAWLQLEVK